MKKHPGFKNVAAGIAAKQGVSQKEASAELAASSRRASPAAKKANPNLKKVHGQNPKSGNTEYSVERTSKSSDAEGVQEHKEMYDRTFPSTESTFTQIPGSVHGKMEETPVDIGGKVDKKFQ